MGPRLEGNSARTVDRRRKTQGRAAFRGTEGEGAEEQEHERGRFSPRHERAGRRGMAIPAAATGASTTTSTAAPTQPALPHPPPHQVSLDSNSRLSSRSSNRSSNLNSSPSSSSSRMRPRGAGFSSQAWPTSAGRLAAVREAEADVEVPTRVAAAPGEAVSDSLFFFFFISLIADGPHRYHPACGHKGSSHPSPVHALQFFYRDASSALLQLVNQWLSFTYSRSQAFRYERKNTNPTLVTIELTTSALVGVRIIY